MFEKIPVNGIFHTTMSETNNTPSEAVPTETVYWSEIKHISTW